MPRRSRTAGAGCWLLLVGLALVPGRVAAIDPDPSAPPPAATADEPGDPARVDSIPGRRFGWQVALVDLGSIALLVGGGSLTSSSSSFAFLPILGGVTYFGGGPLVHGLHDDPGGAGRSFLLRLGAPIATGGLFAGLAALTASSGPSDICYPHDQRTCAAMYGAAVGIAIGMLGAMVADWVTASEPPRRAPPDARPTTPDVATWTVVPVLLEGGSTLAIAGRF